MPQTTVTEPRPPQTAVSPPLLTSEEIAVHFKKTVRAIRSLAKRGKIRGAVKIGRDWRFHPAVLRAGINGSRL